MKIKIIALIYMFVAMTYISQAQLATPQTLDITKGWKILVGDNPAFAQPSFDDKDWKPISVLSNWEKQGYTDMDGVAWYRVKFAMPHMLPSCNSYLKGVVISLGKIDDNDVTYLNGHQIGATEGWDINRKYVAPNEWVNFGGDNVIAIRVTDNSGGGGMYAGDHTLGICPGDLSSFISFASPVAEPKSFSPDNAVVQKTVAIKTSNVFRHLPVTLHVKVYEGNTGKIILDKSEEMELGDHADSTFTFSATLPENGLYRSSFTLYSRYMTDTVEGGDLLMYLKGDHSNPTKVIPVVPNLIPAKSISFDLSKIQLTGYLGDRVDANQVERLLKIDETGILEGFYNRPGKQTWVGEYPGKYLHAAARAWNYSNDTRLKTQMDRIVDILISCQNEDGYLGTYLPADYWSDWDVWAHKYDLLGLLSYYGVTNYQPALKTCERIGDLLCRTFGTQPGQLSIEQSGGHVGMASMSVLEAMVELYRYTGNKKYLDFCNYIIAAYDAPKGPHIISTLNTVGKVNKTANAKAYEMMSNCTGIVKMYQVTGNPVLLSAMQKGWNDIATNRLYITGTSSKGELFQDEHVFPADNSVHMGEGCVSTTWLQFSQALYNLTGHSKYMDEIEKTIYNHLFAAENPNTGCVAYYTALQGVKPYRCNIMAHCCLSSVPRGIAAIPELAFTKNATGGYNINLYSSGSFRDDIITKSGALLPLKLTIASDFPAKGNTAITMDLPQQANFSLALRVPVWAKNYLATIDGKKYNGIPGKYLVLNRTWKKHSTVSVKMDMNVHSLDGGQSYPGYVAIKSGTQVMAFDHDLNPAIKNIEDLKLINSSIAPLSSVSLPANWFGNEVFVIKAMYEGNPVEIKLVPFAEAGQNGGEVRVWIKKQ